MLSSHWTFITALVVGSVLLAVLPSGLPALSAGSLMIGIHVLLTSRRQDLTDEHADAAYFLGFLFTLIYLAFGLWRLGESEITDLDLSGFFRDLATGLVFSIFGLGARQWLILSGRVTTSAMPSGQVPVTETNADTNTLKEPGDANDSSPAAVKERLDAFDDELSARMKTLVAAINAVHEAASKAANGLEQAGTAFARNMREAGERLTAHVDTFAPQFTSVCDRFSATAVSALQEALQTQQQITGGLRQQLAIWQIELDSLHKLIADTHKDSQAEARSVLAALKTSTQALAALAGDIDARVKGMPDPAHRLETLWVTLAKAEGAMSEASAKSAEALRSLDGAASLTAGTLTSLNSDVTAATRDIKESTSALKESLLKEAHHIDRIVHELYAIIEHRINQVGSQ